MSSKLLFTILATTMLIATALQSAEIIPIWNKESGAGDIQDMEILPGGNEFMLTTGGGEIQIRNTENGELIRSHTDNTNLFMNGYFELTPDSTRVVMCISGLLQLINLENFERLNYFAFGNDTIAKGFKDIVLDPIKPYAYVLITGWEKTSGKNELRSKISVYNYETMELVKDLTDYGDYEYTAIAVSDDGKYLATLNDGKAYLKVWDLVTMELIRDVQLYDDKLPNTDWWCDSKDIQFSKLNSDVIYYSGNYPNKIYDSKQNNGIRKFIITTDANSFNIQERSLSGKFILFDKDVRSLICTYGTIFFYNYLDKIQEFYNKPPPEIYVGGKTIYSEKNNYFVGYSGSNFCKFLYDRQTNIESEYEEEIIIAPNPTNSYVNINLNCMEPIINYQINDINGLVLFQTSLQNHVGSLQVDFTSYPSGVYFLSVICNNQPKTYKIIKEG